MRKLRSRLVFAFICMIVLPVLLIGISFYAFMQVQFRAMEKDYGIEVTYDSLSNNASLISNVTSLYITQLENQLKEDSSKLLNESWLDEINEQLKDRYSFLVLRVDEEIVYSGMEDELEVSPEELYEKLPEYQDFDEDQESSVYLSGNIQALVKKIDFLTENNEEASIFIITSSSALLPQIKNMYVALVFIAVLILAIISFVLIIWIYTSINAPLNRLKTATQNIKDGNLDFTVEGCHVAEINDLCEGFEDMRKRLKLTTEEKMAFDQESKALISNISHDLKTPITAIKGYVEGIMDGVADTPEKVDRYIRTIYLKTNEMDRLINELTFYSKIDTNRIPYTFSKIHIADYFDDCAEELAVELEAQNIELTYTCRVDRDTVVIADAEQLKRVINNIISNSIKYMDKEKPKIQIRLRDVGDFVQIEMEDNGKGIEAKNVPYIFERFYRTDASRNSTKGGSGIGLSIVKKIMEDHGGKVWATSIEGEGTIVYFVLRKYQEVPVYE